MFVDKKTRRSNHHLKHSYREKFKMTLKIIGAGFGRTGTYSLKSALDTLGFGPCHHMSEVIGDPSQIGLWSDVVAGKPDYEAIFAGFGAAVDFPVSAYWQEVLAISPDARIILSHRDPEDWYASFSQTILPLIMDKSAWPDHLMQWIELIDKVIIGKAFGGRTDRESILASYRKNEEAAMVQAKIGRGLVFRASDGWKPLCAFLGVDVPDIPYPKTNPRADFFASVKSGGEAANLVAS
jgi:hypothetical protein